MGCVDPRIEGELSTEGALAELERVLSSRIFAHSARLARFLKFGVEAALAGRTDINEYTIGLDVFGRDANFDPRIDPIVRVDARRLRTKLREYYDGEGVDDRIEICLPLRTYIPMFRTRDGRSNPAKPLAQLLDVNRVRESLGIFPFTSLSADQGDAFFADGLTAEVIYALASLDEWRVVAGYPAACGARRPDLREIANELNIDAAVWGTVRKTGSLFRVSADLLTVKDRTVLSSQMYEASVDNAVPMQTEIARAICDAVCSLGQVSRIHKVPLMPATSSSIPTPWAAPDTSSGLLGATS